MSWHQMPEPTRDHWAALGWNECNWDQAGLNKPPSENLDWLELSPAEQHAASALGFDPDGWDADDDDDRATGGNATGASGSKMIIGGLSVVMGLLAIGLYTVYRRYQWSQIKVTASELLELELFMADILRRDPGIHKTWKTSSSVIEDCMDSERPVIEATRIRENEDAIRRRDLETTSRVAGRTVLKQLRGVFASVVQMDPEVSENGELLITPLAWEQFCVKGRADGAGGDHQALMTIFRAADLDNNGGLSFSEFVTILFLLVGTWNNSVSCEDKAELIWRLLDEDHDGELTREELNQFAQIAANFDLLPDEPSGSVSTVRLCSFTGRAACVQPCSTGLDFTICKRALYNVHHAPVQLQREQLHTGMTMRDHTLYDI